MVAQRELDERLRAVVAQLVVEERDWHDEERQLFELEETYLRDTTVHGNVFTGWGDAKTAPIRFRNAALRKKKRERQQSATAGPVTLSADEQLKMDKHRVASFSSVTSPAESILASIAAREHAKVAASGAADKNSSGSSNTSPTAGSATTTAEAAASSDKKRAASEAKPSPAKKTRK